MDFLFFTFKAMKKLIIRIWVWTFIFPKISKLCHDFQLKVRLALA